MSITCIECTFVALGVQHAMRMLHMGICGLSGCTLFSTLCHKRRDLGGEGGLIEHKMCFDFLYNFCLKHFSQ